ncbi:MAG: hypothetical protein CML65_16925 [Rhodobacteraceae bacterium]|nr:hypothetical protein [Paracoccaceae bacterium]
MKPHALASTTAVAMCLALATPAPVLGQDDTESRPFPCLAPTAEVADNPRLLSIELMEYLKDPTAQADTPAPGDGPNCTAGAIRRGIERGGDDMTAALQAAPKVVRNQVIALATADGEPLETPDVTQAPATEAAAPAASEKPKAKPEAKPDATGTRATAETTAPATSQKPKAKDDQAKAATTEAAAPAASERPKTEAQAKSEAKAEAGTDDQPVGEAGQRKLTDAQRQRLAQVRADRREAIAAARSDDPEQASVETETVNEDDVRKADQDFDTAVNETVDAPKEDDKRLSTFEKALLAGLGAAVVGTILNNGDEVVSNSGDRVVVERDGELKVLKNDDELLRQPGAQVQSQTFQDGSTRETVSYEDGSQTITVRAADGTVLRRSVIRAQDGEEVVLFDDTQQADPVDFDALPSVETLAAKQARPSLNDQQALEAALRNAVAGDVTRHFSLQQIRDYKQVRALAPQVELDTVTFATGSAAIQPSQAKALSTLGLSMRDIIEQQPDAVFLIEGHTDAVGSASYNLALSDRRAETVALALTQYFNVPPQNLITQGYGESDLKVSVLTDERANRRAAVRNITGLLY